MHMLTEELTGETVFDNVNYVNRVTNVRFQVSFDSHLSAAVTHQDTDSNVKNYFGNFCHNTTYLHLCFSSVAQLY